LADLSQSTDADSGPYIGGKFSFEAFKNVFLGIAVDWGFHEVDDPPPSVGGVPTARTNQIDQIESYQKVNFLVTADYDVPLWRDPLALIFRMGVATGVAWVKLEERADTLNTFESVWSWVFRPSIGLRKPINENFLIFIEGSYDLIPQRSLETNETATVVGQRPVFSSGGVWVGVAFQW
jgi:hypothetical protein